MRTDWLWEFGPWEKKHPSITVKYNSFKRDSVKKGIFVHISLVHSLIIWTFFARWPEVLCFYKKFGSNPKSGIWHFSRSQSTSRASILLNSHLKNAIKNFSPAFIPVLHIFLRERGRLPSTKHLQSLFCSFDWFLSLSVCAPTVSPCSSTNVAVPKVMENNSCKKCVERNWNCS